MSFTILLFFLVYEKTNCGAKSPFSERQIGQQYADVTAAVRALLDDFGLRCIVDGSMVRRTLLLQNFSQQNEKR